MIRLLLLIFMLPFTGVYSQYNARNISGVVKCADDFTPLESVTVTIKGTKRISGTQPDGAFYIDVQEQDSVIVFSLKGFETKEIKLTNTNDYPVTLKKLEGDQYENCLPEHYCSRLSFLATRFNLEKPLL